MAESYLRDGDAIYRRSFAIIRAEADLTRLRPEDRIDVVKIDPATDGPAVGLELGGIGDFRQRLVATGAREAVGHKAAALRRHSG